MNKFKTGQLVVYHGSNGYEIGKIKRICDDGESAFVWYHTGETAAKTKFRDMRPIVNEYCITETAFGGQKPEPRAYQGRTEMIPGVAEGSMAEHFLMSVEPDEDMGGW